MADLPELLPEELPYADYGRRLYESCLIGAAHMHGKPLFHGAPLLLPEALVDRMYTEARRIGSLFEELCHIVWDEPALLDTFFHLPPFYKLMWLSSSGAWHGFARMDMFLCDDGRLQICELNADTPSGQVEALAPYELLTSMYPALRPVNRDYEAQLWQVLCRYHRHRTGDDSDPTRIGILYPTDLPEDQTLIRLYQRWFEARGAKVILGAPHNLRRDERGRISLLGEPVELILRHYKTDWWGERPRIFADEDEVPDATPLLRELSVLLTAEREGDVVVVNPFGAILPQNKLSMAFCHEQKHRFSHQAQRTIEDLIPETRRLDVTDRDMLRRERAQWVLKSDYGCEGDEVIVGAYVSDEQWQRALEAALPGVWCVQRFFRISPITGPDAAPWLPNYGVYLVGGHAAGLFVRLSPEGATTGVDARVTTPFFSPLC
ncbi:MAG: glutathionylspermidine synthase family protein [Myxococcota bacterium]